MPALFTALTGLGKSLQTIGPSIRNAASGIKSTLNQAGGVVGGLAPIANNFASAAFGINVNFQQLLPGLNKLNIAMFALGVSISLMKDAFDELIAATKEFQKVDERLVVINSNLRDNSVSQLTTSRDLTGGLLTNTEVLTELRIAGFNDLNVSLVELGSRMKLTGQDTRGLIKASKDLATFGGVSSESLSEIADSMIETSLRNGVSLDNLVNNLTAINRNTSLDMRLLSENASTRLAEIATGLGGMVDQQGQETVKLFMDSISKMDQSTIANLKRLGVADEIFSKLSQDQKLSNAEILSLVSTITKASNQMQQGLQGEKGSPEAVLALQAIGGDTLKSALALEAALEKGVRDTGGVDNTNYLLENLKQRFLAPALQAAKAMEPAFKELKKGVAFFTSSIINFLSNFSPAISLIMNIIAFGFKAVGVVVQGISTIFGVVKDIVMSIVTLFLGAISDAVAGIGALFAKMTSGFLYILDYLPGIEYTAQERADIEESIAQGFRGVGDSVMGSTADLIGAGDRFREQRDAARRMDFGALLKASFRTTAANMETWGAAFDANTEMLVKNYQASMDLTNATKKLSEDMKDQKDLKGTSLGDLNKMSFADLLINAGGRQLGELEGATRRIAEAEFGARQIDLREDLAGKIKAKLEASDESDDTFDRDTINTFYDRAMSMDNDRLQALYERFSVFEDGNKEVGELLNQLIAATNGTTAAVKSTANDSQNNASLRGGR